MKLLPVFLLLSLLFVGCNREVKRPDVPYITKALVNEFYQIDDKFVVVLDISRKQDIRRLVDVDTPFDRLVRLYTYCSKELYDTLIVDEEILILYNIEYDEGKRVVTVLTPNAEHRKRFSRE